MTPIQVLSVVVAMILAGMLLVVLFRNLSLEQKVRKQQRELDFLRNAYDKSVSTISPKDAIVYVSTHGTCAGYFREWVIAENGQLCAKISDVLSDPKEAWHTFPVTPALELRAQYPRESAEIVRKGRTAFG